MPAALLQACVRRGLLFFVWRELLSSLRTTHRSIKPYVDSIDQRVMFAEKSWGSYRVLGVSDKSMTVK